MIYVYAKKKSSIEEQIALLSEIKKDICSDKLVKELFKDYNFSEEVLLGVAISFSDDIDSTAKTVNGQIFLNTSLLDESDDTIGRYIIHELTHVFQHIEKQKNGQNKKKSDNSEDYLSKPEEIEAFQNQIAYNADKTSRKEVEDYVFDLLEYHEVEDEDEADDVWEVLMEKVN